MMEKIGRVINAADEAYLDHLIETDSVVAAVWHQTLALYTPEDIDNGFSRFDQLGWQDITTSSNNDLMPVTMPWEQEKPTNNIVPLITPDENTDIPQPRRRLVIRAAAAAALLIGALASWWLFRSAPANHQHLTLSDKRQGVQLQLANGKMVNLSTDSGAIALQQLQLINNNKTLSLATSTIDSSKGNEKLTLAVPVGLDYKVKLPDGTDVWLNSATTMRFSVPFQGNVREVFIDGEAFINVTKDAVRPFLVRTARGTVQVLGTSFNVNTYDSGSVKVSLVDGVVKMKDITLKPGQQAVASNNGIRVQPFDELEELSWRQGIFYFSNTTLADITRILPRWFGITVIMDNTRIAGETFTGNLERSQPITVFLENLKSTTTVDYYFDKNSRLHFR